MALRKTSDSSRLITRYLMGKLSAPFTNDDSLLIVDLIGPTAGEASQGEVAH